jgi:hypothetical protein
MRKILPCGLLALALFLPAVALAPAEARQTRPAQLISEPLLSPDIAWHGQRPLTPVQQKEDECHPWQHKNQNGECVDDPGVEHHHGHYDQGPGEQCWVECLCEDGQYPSGNSCSPCSYVGMVCKK